MTVDDAHPPRGEKSFFGHPFGLFYLVFAEAFERFSYYGMRALLTLYLAQQLLLPGHVEHVAGLAAFRGVIEHFTGALTVPALASIIVGFYGLTYLTPLAGGFIADRWLGRRTTVTIGAIVVAFGHFLMVFEQTFLPAMACILVGIGCFKGNISSQVGALYGPDDVRRGTAFQIFYLVFDIAVIVAPIVCGTLGQKIAWHWGFGAAGVSMLLGLVVYLSGAKYLPAEAPRKAIDRAVQEKLSGRDWQKIAVLLLILPLLGASLLMNMQIFNNYLTWGNDSFNLVFFGQAVPSSWLVSLDAIMGMVFLSAGIAFWRWWATKRPEPDEMTKIAFAGIFAAAAPLALAAAAMTVTPGHKASLWWAILFEVLNSIAFAHLVPVGLALFARVAPPQVNGSMIGIYMLSFFFADAGAGAIGSLLGRLGAVNFWLLHAAIVGAATIGLFIVWRVFGKLLAPVKV